VAKVILGITGSIAAYKACEVVRQLQDQGHDVHVVLSTNAHQFVTPLTLAALSRHPVSSSPFVEESDGTMRHIELAASAALLLIAPASADVIAKLAHGIADDALTTLALVTTAPLVIAPAMNVNMWQHPAVRENVATLTRRGAILVEPGVGALACGWQGQGRLADVPEIVATVARVLSLRRDLAGETVLITAGPTQEDLDPVRFISNRSSGRMGFSLAESAQERGARVLLVSGPTALATPAGVERADVRSAAEMAQAVSERLSQATIVVMAAAVCDHRPAKRAERKLKRSAFGASLELEVTPDILKSVAAEKGPRFVVGFAAETNDLRQNAEGKLRDKKLDLIVANDVSRADGGFASDHNAALLLDAQGGEEEIPLMTKRELAERIWDRVRALKDGRRES
jgi:phosphopantothenoylcysteine decarboxylase / phosphopantothenate---cysteine ligase